MWQLNSRCIEIRTMSCWEFWCHWGFERNAFFIWMVKELQFIKLPAGQNLSSCFPESWFVCLHSKQIVHLNLWAKIVNAGHDWHVQSSHRRLPACSLNGISVPSLFNNPAHKHTQPPPLSAWTSFLDTVLSMYTPHFQTSSPPHNACSVFDLAIRQPVHLWKKNMVWKDLWGIWALTSIRSSESCSRHHSYITSLICPLILQGSFLPPSVAGKLAANCLLLGIQYLSYGIETCVFFLNDTNLKSGKHHIRIC